MQSNKNAKGEKRVIYNPNVDDIVVCVGPFLYFYFLRDSKKKR